MTYCFEALEADEVISLIRPDNAASAAVARRIGHRLLREETVMGVHAHVYGQSRPAL